MRGLGGWRGPSAMMSVLFFSSLLGSARPLPAPPPLPPSTEVVILTDVPPPPPGA